MRELEERVRLFYERLWNRWQFELAPELLAPGMSFRGSLGSEVLGPSGFVEYARTVRAAFPDFHNRVEELVADDVNRSAAARLMYSGTHEGAIFGAPPTGRRVTYAGAAFFRFDDDGRISRAWVLGDLVELFRQLGIDTPPPASRRAEGRVKT